MTTPAPLRVLVLEDRGHWTRAAIEAAGTPGDRTIKIIPDVCTTAFDLIDAIQDDRPDVVLIDNFVPWERGRAQQPWAVRTVIEITSAYGTQHPLKILWTTRPFYPDELTAYAFWRFGGHNVADKDVDDPEARVAEVIRATAAGERWRPAVPRSPDRFVRDKLALVAALEAGYSNKEAGEWLARRKGRAEPYHASVIGVWVNELRKRLGIEANAPDKRDRKRGDVVAEAYRQGYRWIRPEHWHWADTLHFVPPID